MVGVVSALLKKGRSREVIWYCAHSEYDGPDEAMGEWVFGQYGGVDAE